MRKKIKPVKPVQKRFRVYADDLLEWLGSQPSLQILHRLGITSRQYKIWLGSTKGIWISAAQYSLIQFNYRFHLAEILGKEWSDFVIHGDRIAFPGVRRTLSARELSATWLYIQQVGSLSVRLEQATRENARLVADLEDMEHQVHFYRSQLKLEARLGIMLSRITAI